MFEQLKKAFSSVTSSISQKEITSKELEKTLSNIELELLECDIAQEALDDIFAKLKNELVGQKLEKDQSAEDLIRSRLRVNLAQMFINSGSIDLLQAIRRKIESKSGPFVIVFLGINGSGKTTTVAKVGNLLRINGLSAVMAAADTHRSGAIEQLSVHGEKLSLKVIAQRYGADPSAVARDAVEYAKKHFIDVVLIDTAGRMQTSKNLMDEISKVVRVVKPDFKLFVGDSLAGNDTINQAREFFQYTNFDAAILTKADADSKGGSAISIVHITSKPILYFGVGQAYGDILPFHYDKFLSSIFGSYSSIDTQDRRNQIANQNKKEEYVDVHDTYKPEITTSRVLVADDMTSKTYMKDKAEKSSFSLLSESKKPSQISEPTHATVSYLTDPKASMDSGTSMRRELDKDAAAKLNPDPISMKSDDSVSIAEKKGGLFSSFFKRKKKVKKDNDGTENKNNESHEQSGDESSTMDLAENKGTGLDSVEQKNQDTIYLSDDDIEDLIK